MKLHLAVAAVLAAFFIREQVCLASADEPRGLGHPDGPVHWYDAGCCDMKDCEPVEPGAIRQQAAGYYVQYRSSRGFLVRGFVPNGSPAIRPSRDANEHACATAQLLLCIYLPLGS